MKDLIDLIHIITKPKLREVELMNDSRPGTSKLQDFYTHIAEGQFQDDDTAASRLYGASKDAPVYQKLRKNLKDRLVNSLFLIDLKQASYTNRQKAFYECYKEWAAAKILFGKNARNAAVGIARKLLKISRKYEFTELNVDICHTLRLYHGTMDGDYAKYQQYHQELMTYEKLWILENKAEHYYIELSIGFVNSRAPKADIQAKAQEYYAEIEPTLKTYNSYQLHLCAHLVEAAIYSSINDYPNLIDVCNRTIAFFEQKEYTAAIPLQVFYYQKAICHVQLREFDLAKQATEECLKYSDNGNFNWFKTYELNFMLHMHEGNYLQSQAILYMVMQHQQFADLPENIQGIWKISEAYLHFLVQIKALDTAESGISKKRKFRLNKFFNELQVFYMDKQGMNIHLIFLEILFNIANHQYDELIDRVEALDKYRMRYLQDGVVLRCNYFLKMLLQIPKSSFRKADILQKAAPDFQALMALPIEMANQTFEIEVLPYEKLWEYALNCLE